MIETPSRPFQTRTVREVKTIVRPGQQRTGFRAPEDKGPENQGPENRTAGKDTNRQAIAGGSSRGLTVCGAQTGTAGRRDHSRPQAGLSAPLTGPPPAPSGCGGPRNLALGRAVPLRARARLPGQHGMRGMAARGGGQPRARPACRSFGVDAALRAAKAARSGAGTGSGTETAPARHADRWPHGECESRHNGECARPARRSRAGEPGGHPDIRAKHAPRTVRRFSHRETHRDKRPGPMREPAESVRT